MKGSMRYDKRKSIPETEPEIAHHKPSRMREADVLEGTDSKASPKFNRPMLQQGLAASKVIQWIR